MRLFILTLGGWCTVLSYFSQRDKAPFSRGPSDPGLVLSGMDFGYQQRLEAQLPYQQALLPLGITRLSSKWTKQQASCRLLTGEASPVTRRQEAGKTSMQEVYALSYFNDHWGTLFTSRYTEAPSAPFAGQGLPTSHNYFYTEELVPLQDPTRPTRVLIHKNFDPLRVVEGHAPPQPAAACFFYVLDVRPGLVGDTLARYGLSLAEPGGPYHLVLQQRDEYGASRQRNGQPLRRWRGRNLTTQQWDYNPATRRLKASLRSGRTTREWTRTYGAKQHFVEVLEERSLLGEHGGATVSHIMYKRVYTRTAGHTDDQYTVYIPNTESIFEPWKETIKVSISTDYR